MNRTSQRLALAAVLLALVASLANAAQTTSTRIVRLGYLHLQPITPEPSPERRAFLEALRTLGYEEGRNLIIEYRSAFMRAELLPDLVKELLAAKVDLIVAIGSEAAGAAKQTTTSLPIVVPAVADFEGAGLVASLARPGGNVTGLSFMAPELAGKRLELLKEAFPRISRVAILWNAGNAGATREWEAAQEPARALGLALQRLEIRSVQDLPGVLSTLGRDRPHALYVVGDPVTSPARHIIVTAANDLRLPTMYSWREFVDVGGLMAYSAPFPELFKRAAVYVDRIVRGARPADLPIEQPTRFELVINLKTAKALGLTIPPALMMRADQIIE